MKKQEQCEEKNVTPKTLGIIGAGSFGTAMAITAARAGTRVTLMTQSQEQAAEINLRHTNSAYFSELPLPDSIHATTLLESIKTCDAVMLTVPAAALNETIKNLEQILPPTTPIILTSKGLVTHNDVPTLPFFMQRDLMKNPCVVLAGPNFAREIALHHPTATSLAANDLSLAQRMCEFFHHPTFRTYPSDDPIGCQAAGIVKNVLAIGCGFVAGKGFGANTQAAVITRGLAEMVRLGTTLGAKPTTFMGLAGMGDLVLTCTSTQSRNYALGFALGQGVTLEEVLTKKDLAEGYYSAPILMKLAKNQHVNMPLCHAVHDMLSGVDVDYIIDSILHRPTSPHEFLETRDVLVA